MVLYVKNWKSYRRLKVCHFAQLLLPSFYNSALYPRCSPRNLSIMTMLIHIPSRYILAVQKLVNICVQGPSTSANECILPMPIRFMHWPGIKFCVWRLHAYCSNMMPLYDTYILFSNQSQLGHGVSKVRYKIPPFPWLMQIYSACVHFKRDKVDLKKNTVIFFQFLQSPHQVNMKNVVECWKEFFRLFQCSRNIEWLTLNLEVLYFLKLCWTFVGPTLCKFTKYSNFLENH